MNILYVVHDNKKGGAAVSFLEMVSYLSKEHKVYVLTPHKKGYIPQKLDEMNIPHRVAHFFWWKVKKPQNKFLGLLVLGVYRILNVYNYVEAFRVRGFVKEKQIELIHSNSGVINFGALLSSLTDVPHIWHLREYGEEDFQLVRTVSKKRYIYLMSRGAKKYIAISKSIAKKFEHIVGSEKIIQIYNGVSQEYMYEKKWLNSERKDIRFLISGSFCEEKGQKDVVNAIIELRKKGYDNFMVYFAGNGDFRELENYAIANEVMNHVKFCGLVDDMVQLRKDTDVEIVASRCEAFGRVTIEAMRMSNPVIGTNTGGTSELVEDGVSGFLYSPGDYVELAEKMSEFINDTNLISILGTNAYESTKNAFTAQDNAMKINELYLQYLQNK